MKTKSLISLVLFVFVRAIAFAAADDDSGKQLQIFPKNLARQNVGTNLFVFNAANQAYVPTEAAAAWLDDDVATGWPPTAGHSYYLISLSEAQLLTNFALSAKSGSGTINLFAGDQPAAPGAKSWTLIARGVSVDSINNKKLGKPFSRLTKYLLVETNIENPAPWYSLYLYGEKPAVSYSIQSRAQPVDTRSIFGPYVNSQTAFNLSSLYSGARVTYASSDAGALAWQKMIDDNPESTLSIASTQNDAGIVIDYMIPRAIERISVMAGAGAKGRLDFFLIGAPEQKTPTASAASEKSDYIRAAFTEKEKAAGAHSALVSGQAVPLGDLTPVASIVMDGVNPRGSIDMPPVTASKLLVRWTPETAGDKIAIAEINSFSDLALNDHELVTSPEAVAEEPEPQPQGTQDTSKDSGGKEALPPVGEFLPGKTPFVPYTLGPNTNLPLGVEPPVSP